MITVTDDIPPANTMQIQALLEDMKTADPASGQDSITHARTARMENGLVAPRVQRATGRLSP